MKQTKKTKKTESGRSMIEMVGVLAVMGLITAGAFVLITSAMKSQKISRVDDDVSAIAAGVRLMYNSAENFTGITNDVVGALGFSGNNPYGGSYYVSGTGTTFYVYIGGLSSSDCKALTGRKFPGGGDTVTGGTGVQVSGAGVASLQGTSCPASGTGAVRITYQKVQSN